MALRILALEPYFTGSHAAILNGLVNHSEHDYELVTLPGRLWKWRMRAGAIDLAKKIDNIRGDFDVIFATDYVDLPTLIGLRPDRLGAKPVVFYMHENQLSYPTRVAQERDHHFAVTNLLSMLRADQIWFNSDWHRRDFLMSARRLLAQFPEGPHDWLRKIEPKIRVVYPGVTEVPEPSRKGQREGR